MMSAEVMHLTHVAPDGPTPGKRWEATCQCGWQAPAPFKLKRDAVNAAELHWLSMPLVMRNG